MSDTDTQDIGQLTAWQRWELPAFETKPQAVLFVSTRAKRTLEDVSSATQKALTEIDAAMKKLGVTQAGPRITVTTDYGDQNYAFDIAVPINTSTLTVAGQSYDLTQPGTPDAAAACCRPAA